MIAYQQECHTDGEPKIHEWTELADGRWRSICSRWTESRDNLASAPQVTCEWCQNRKRRRQQASVDQPEGN